MAYPNDLFTSPPLTPAPKIKPLPFLHEANTPEATPSPFTRFIALPKTTHPIRRDTPVSREIKLDHSMEEAEDPRLLAAQQRIRELQEQNKELATREDLLRQELTQYKEGIQQLTERETRATEQQAQLRQLKVELNRRTQELNQRVRLVNEVSRELSANKREQHLQHECEELRARLQATELALTRSQKLVESLTVEKRELEQVIHCTNATLRRDSLGKRGEESFSALKP